MINLRMKRYDMDVVVQLSSSDDTSINSAGILGTIERLLNEIDMYDNIHITVTRTGLSDSGISLGPVDTITVTNHTMGTSI